METINETTIGTIERYSRENGLIRLEIDVRDIPELGEYYCAWSIKKCERKCVAAEGNRERFIQKVADYLTLKLC